MTAFSALRASISHDLSDDGGDTFDVVAVKDMVNAGIAEISRFAPRAYQEDITPVADTLSYRLQSSVFSAPEPEIMSHRVEVWDNSRTPPWFLFLARSLVGEYMDTTSAGWEVFGGLLSLTNAQASVLDPARHLIRVWGYSPYPQLVNDNDTFPGPKTLEFAVRKFCRVEALRRLSLQRDLFTQWQRQPNNSDVSPASLLSALAAAEDDWRRTARNLVIQHR